MLLLKVYELFLKRGVILLCIYQHFAILQRMRTARVIEEHKTNYIILDESSEFTATVRGSFFEEDTFPKVGDFVIYEEVADGKAVIEEMLPRTSTVARKVVETNTEQVIVANVDLIFIVMGLDNDFNLSRLERYLLLAKQSGVASVVILNKSDCVDDYSEYVTRTKEVAGTTPVHAVSALSGEGMELLLAHITSDTTAVLLGSSGAGKSTITNWLLRQNTQQVNSVRGDDSRGKHTTTSRQLFALPTGGYLIDTPGMRELSVSDSTTDDEDVVFALFETLSNQCQFTNCDHKKSKGCAIVSALENGEVLQRQLQNYKKLQRERLFEESKRDEDLSQQQKQKNKKLHKSYRNAHKKKFSDHQC